MASVFFMTKNMPKEITSTPSNCFSANVKNEGCRANKGKERLNPSKIQERKRCFKICFRLKNVNNKENYFISI